MTDTTQFNRFSFFLNPFNNLHHPETEMKVVIFQKTPVEEGKSSTTRRDR